MILKKNSNKSYVIFLVAMILAIIIITILSVTTSNEKESKTSNYGTVVKLNSYSVKVFDAMYNSKAQEISFYIGVKTDYSTASEPEITEIFINNSTKYTCKTQKSSENIYYVTIPNVSDDFDYVRLKISSKKPDIQPAPKEDEFGEIVTQPITKGETSNIYVYIDYRDFNEYKNIKYSPTLSTTSPASTTSTTVTPQTSSVVTTTTVATTKLEPVTVTTTTTVATKKPTSESLTTTSKATTTTTKKSTTSTAKKTTTTKKATTTTTTAKKTTTTKVTTTKATTTTVYVKLTGLEIQQKGQENLVLGESVTLTPIFHPNKATNKKLTWISNRTDRVLVDENGKCTAVGEGAAIITCVSDDGGLRASYMIVGVDG